MQSPQQTTVAQSYPTDSRHQRQSVERTLAGTFGVSAVAGLAVVVLAILALADIIPLWLTGVAVIAAGFAFLVEGAGIASRTRQIQRSVGAGDVENSALGGGVSIQLLAGASGITLGILALVGIEPMVLLGASIIVFGAALLLGTLATYETAKIEAQRHDEGRLTYQTIQTSNGARILVGIASLVLGVLAVVGWGPALILTQAGLLAVGAILLLSGSAIGARFGMASGS